MAFIVMAFIVMAYTVMAYVATTYIAMAYIAMTYMLIARVRRVECVRARQCLRRHMRAYGHISYGILVMAY